jgi:hypothetical protein
MKNFITFNTGRVYDFPQVIEAAIIREYICPIFENTRHVVYFKDDSRGLDYLINIPVESWLCESQIMRHYDSNESCMKDDANFEDREVFEAIKAAQAI